MSGPMIGRGDATAALASVDDARRRAGELRGYAQAGGTLVLWGMVWLVCNLLSQFFRWGPLSWPFGILIGVIGSVVQGRRHPTGNDWRIGLTVLAVSNFLALLTVIAGVHDPATMNAAISLTVAAVYVVAGVWAGARFAYVGLALAALVAIGWFGDPRHLYLWLGLGGGGALILSGWWLRRA